MQPQRNNASDLELARARLRGWAEAGPAVFAEEALGAKPLAWQREAGKNLVERRRVSIRSGHGVGKTAFEAWCVLWFMCTRFPAKVPVTAATAHQLEDVLWAELAVWHRKLSERMPPLAAEFVWKADSYSLVAAPKESFAVARTSRAEQPEALQGFHGANLLFLIDEASGIPNSVFEVAEGALSSPGAYVVMAGNPTRMDGYFYDTHHKHRAQWATMHVSGEDCELVSKEYIQGMRDRYGEDSAIYRIRVLGQFAGTPDGVIPLDLVASAVERKVEPFGDHVWGLDVARFGADRTALAKRRGNKLIEPVIVWSNLDTMQTVGRLKIEYDNAHPKPKTIHVDSIGIGAGVVDRGREIGLPVNGINVAEAPAVGEKYVRLRDELWFKAREWFEARNVTIPPDEHLIAELTLPSFKITSSGKIQIEAKEEMKKRSVNSPDLADAFCLTFAVGGAAIELPPLNYPKVWRA